MFQVIKAIPPKHSVDEEQKRLDVLETHLLRVEGSLRAIEYLNSEQNVIERGAPLFRLVEATKALEDLKSEIEGIRKDAVIKQIDRVIETQMELKKRILANNGLERN